MFWSIISYSTTGALILLSVISLMINSFLTMLLEIFFSIVVMLFALKFLLSSYFVFFKILYERRKHEFKEFHGSHEIALAGVILSCLIWHIWIYMKAMLIYSFLLSLYILSESCQKTLTED